MNEQTLIEKLAGGCANAVPERADIIALQQLSLDELRGRGQRFLTMIEQQDECSHDRADWTTHDDHTMVNLAQGARVVVYHASGALQYVSGMAPLENLFARVEEREPLIRQVEAVAKRLNVAAWAGDRSELVFERLWQNKAQGADRNDRRSEVVLARVVGAYRQRIGGIPVLGAASVAVKLAGDGRLDGLSIQMRQATGETIDTAPILAPELGARAIVQQLLALLGRSSKPLPGDVVESALLYFGYLDLGKRKTQRVLAPAYVAQVVLRHEMERQAYMLAVPATERPYLQLPLYGVESVVTRSRVGQHCEDVIR
jgi:hypothetical protein